MIRKIIKKLSMVYYTSSSDRYVKYLRKEGAKIGARTVVFDPKRVQIDLTRPELLDVGEHVFIHRGTIILTHDWASWCFVERYNEFIPSHSKVKIGNNCWFGENVTIMPGVEIGDNVIIGLGSIVTKSIPSNSVAVGAPARVICSMDDYFEKRKLKYVYECIEYAKAIINSGQELTKDIFYDDYPCFVNGENYRDYNYNYNRIFTSIQFEIWKKNHKSLFNGFEEFVNAVKENRHG